MSPLRQAARSSLLVVGGLACCALVGCSDKTGEDTAPPIETTTHETGDNCVGGTAPVVSAVMLENTGLARYENDDWPTLTVWATAADDDWDLNAYKLQIWFDDTVDGTVAEGDDNGFDAVGTLAEENCGAAEGTVGIQIFLTGGGIAYNTLYEWGAVVTDAHELASEMVTTSGYTPTETGEDGAP